MQINSLSLQICKNLSLKMGLNKTQCQYLRIYVIKIIIILCINGKSYIKSL